MKNGFVVTYVMENGNRRMTGQVCGRNVYATKEEAEKALRAFIDNNSVSTLEMLYGDVNEMEVREVECYDNGDPTRSIFPK